MIIGNKYPRQFRFESEQVTLRLAKGALSRISIRNLLSKFNFESHKIKLPKFHLCCYQLIFLFICCRSKHVVGYQKERLDESCLSCVKAEIRRAFT